MFYAQDIKQKNSNVIPWFHARVQANTDTGNTGDISISLLSFLKSSDKSALVSKQGDRELTFIVVMILLHKYKQAVCGVIN